MWSEKFLKVTDRKLSRRGANLTGPGSNLPQDVPTHVMTLHKKAFRNSRSAVSREVSPSTRLGRYRIELSLGLGETIPRRRAVPMGGGLVTTTNKSIKLMQHTIGGSVKSSGKQWLTSTLLVELQLLPYLNTHRWWFCQNLLASSATRHQYLYLDKRQDKELLVELQLLVELSCCGGYSCQHEMSRCPWLPMSKRYGPEAFRKILSGSKTSSELALPSCANSQFAMPENHLHIWPRGTYMMIALPNQDKSWTVTLFMPFHVFGTLSTPEILLNFFKENYNDAIDLIGKEKLIDDFFSNKALPLISVKCSPYHIGSKALLLGDAAHAMVPFYGQGMNCGMEDCVVLNEILDKYNDDLIQSLPAYSEQRNPDAQAIVELALYNYVEVRSSITSNPWLIEEQWDRVYSPVSGHHWPPNYVKVYFIK
ncbi:unnamed protein product, partial [Meganyctiphanes norvegica]